MKMPNYSHGTKLTLASAEEPPYLNVGTDVSAKYKGAFCEAKITDVNKHVKLRVLFDGSSATCLIDDSYVKAGSSLETGSKIEAKHPEKRQKTYVQATITKILDHSRYTVVFDDGDHCVLRRNSICLKSGKHFAESETLDQLPLTNPEHFGNPVKVGAVEQEQNQHNSNSKNNLSNHDHNNHNQKQNSTSTTNSRGQNNRVTKAKTTTSTTSSSATTTSSSTTTNSTSSTNANSGGGGGGRGRGALKGRKRRESINSGSKHTNNDLDDDSMDSAADSADADMTESNVKFELIDIGVKLMVQYGKGKVQNVYEAKVNKIETNSSGKTRYHVHYTGWNNRYDEWITKNRIQSIVTEKDNGTKDGRSRQTATPTADNSATSQTGDAAPAFNARETAPTTAVATTAKPPENATLALTTTKVPTTTKAPTTAAVPTTAKTSTPAKPSTAAKAPTTTTSSTTTTTASTTAKTPTTTKVSTTSKASTTPKVPATTKAPATPKASTTTTPPAAPTPPPPITTSSTAATAPNPTTTSAPTTMKVLTTTATTTIPIPKATSTMTTTTTTTTTIAFTTATASTTTSATAVATLTPSTNSISASTASTSPMRDYRALRESASTPPTSTSVPSPPSSLTNSSSMQSKQDSIMMDNADDRISSIDHSKSAASPGSRPVYKFCDDINESDCDKKISILQERIMALRSTYQSLKNELADLDKRRKRPRMQGISITA